MTIRLPFAGFRLLLYFQIFLHIFGVYGSIFKIFSVIDIKIKFPVVLRKQTWRSDCLSAGFWLFLYVLNISPYLWCFWSNFQTFLGNKYQNSFSHCYEHLLCNLLWLSSSHKIKQGLVFIFSNKSILDF